MIEVDLDGNTCSLCTYSLYQCRMRVISVQMGTKMGRKELPQVCHFRCTRYLNDFCPRRCEYDRLTRSDVNANAQYRQLPAFHWIQVSPLIQKYFLISFFLKFNDMPVTIANFSVPWPLQTGNFFVLASDSTHSLLAWSLEAIDRKTYCIRSQLIGSEHFTRHRQKRLNLSKFCVHRNVAFTAKLDQ